MGRFMRNFRKKIEERIEDAVNEATGNSSSGSKSGSGSGSSNSAGKMNQINAQNEFENNKPDSMRKDVRMISGCDDTQTSADVSNVNSFCLPDPAGQAGGACTSTLLNILYKDETVPEDTMSFTEVLEKMRTNLKENGYSQIPQLTSLNPIDITTDFTLVPTTTGGGGSSGGSGVLRAVMIGINYVGHEQGELSGCHNDVLNMKKYIMNVHGFEEDNIVVLMDDDQHISPTKSNIINAYKQIINDSNDGDTIFLHYSGHGTKLRDDSGDEDDGYDEALCPLDYNDNGMLIDDELFDILIEPLSQGVHMVSLMDCCHSGTILDLPYIFKPNSDGTMPTSMSLDDTINLDGLIEQFGGKALGLLVNFLTKSLQG